MPNKTAPRRNNFQPRGNIVADAAAQSQNDLDELAKPRDRDDVVRLSDCIERTSVILWALYRREREQSPRGVSLQSRIWHAETDLDVQSAAYETLDREPLLDLAADAMWSDRSELGRTTIVQVRARLTELTDDDQAFVFLRNLTFYRARGDGK